MNKEKKAMVFSSDMSDMTAARMNERLQELIGIAENERLVRYMPRQPSALHKIWQRLVRAFTVSRATAALPRTHPAKPAHS
jgi:hypothetical protein